MLLSIGGGSINSLVSCFILSNLLYQPDSDVSQRCLDKTNARNPIVFSFKMSFTEILVH